MLELRRDCAFNTSTSDGRTRHKLRGRVFKGRGLSGDEAEWVVLDTVHEAVEVLLEINNDPTHLFGYRLWPTSPPRLSNKINERLAAFQDHLNALFGAPDGPFIPTDGDQPWDFTTRQFRRTLAWHIAHQPFGVVAGARQYHHAKLAMFEGYAGTSSSGFAAEVAVTRRSCSWSLMAFVSAASLSMRPFHASSPARAPSGSRMSPFMSPQDRVV